MISYFINKVPSQTILEIAFRFKKIRKSKKFSQAETAERSGVTLGSLKRFEQTGQIALDSFLRLLFALNRITDLDDILQPKTDLKTIEKLFDV